MTFEYLGGDETKVTFANGDTCIMRSDEIDELVDFQNNKNKEVSLEEIQKNIKATFESVEKLNDSVNADISNIKEMLSEINYLNDVRKTKINIEKRQSYIISLNSSIANLEDTIGKYYTLIEELDNVS